METLTIILKAMEKALSIYDKYLSTKYQRQFQSIVKRLSVEEAKPYDKRDQNLIDHMLLDLDILLKEFLNHDEKKNNK
jgi:hypothetical protein